MPADGTSTRERGSLGFLSPAEVAELLGLGSRAVYNMIADGELPAYKFRGRFRIKPKDLQDLIDRSRL